MHRNSQAETLLGLTSFLRVAAAAATFSFPALTVRYRRSS